MANFGPVAVVIPTKNRPDDLDLTIETVFAQTFLPEQLIVIDQSPADDSERRVLRRFQTLDSKARDSLELLYRRDACIEGVSAARNFAFDLVRTEIVLFLDDDVILESGFIEQVLETYRDNPEAKGVSGIVTNYSPPSVPLRVWSRLFMLGPFWDDRQPIYWNADQVRWGGALRVTRFTGALMSFRMSAIAGAQFDEALRDGEDIEFCLQLGAAALLLITPKARLVHKRTPVARSREHWLSKHASTMWYLYRRNWDFGICKRLCFLWLNVGYALAATLISIRRWSLVPWTGFANAIRASQALVLRSTTRAKRTGIDA